MFSIGYLLEHNRWLSGIGIIGVIGLCYLFSTNKKRVVWSQVIKALLAQLALAVLFLRFPVGHTVINHIASGVCLLNDYAQEGAQFVFGNLVNATGSWGFIFACKVLPVTIFLSALTSLLLHFGIIQIALASITRYFAPFFGVSRSESAVAIANSFLSQTEAPLLVKHTLSGMTKSEFFLVMLSGMATISSAILVVYAAMGMPALHLITCSIMSIPGSIMIAKLLVPEDGVLHDSLTAQDLSSQEGSLFDAIATGTSQGLMMALHIGAFLISFIALLACANGLLGLISQLWNTLVPTAVQIPSLSVALLGSYLFAPVGYLLGFTGADAFSAAEFISLKVMVNELIAYTGLATAAVDDRMKAVLTYALCGFSNFSSIGIQQGALGVLAPGKKSVIARLGVAAVLGAAASNIVSAMIANILIG